MTQAGLSRTAILPWTRRPPLTRMATGEDLPKSRVVTSAYTLVVATRLWPSRSWTRRTLTPYLRCGWRRLCGEQERPQAVAGVVLKAEPAARRVRVEGEGLRRGDGGAANGRGTERGGGFPARLASWVCDMVVGGGQAERASQKVSQRPLSSQHRRAMMALAPRTVQRMPDCLRRWPMIVLQPASTTPEPTKRPRRRKSA